MHACVRVCGGGRVGGGGEGGRGYIQEYEPIIMTYTAVRDPADEADERQVACVKVWGSPPELACVLRARARAVHATRT